MLRGRQHLEDPDDKLQLQLLLRRLIRDNLLNDLVNLLTATVVIALSAVVQTVSLGAVLCSPNSKIVVPELHIGEIQVVHLLTDLGVPRVKVQKHFVRHRAPHVLVFTCEPRIWKNHKEIVAAVASRVHVFRVLDSVQRSLRRAQQNPARVIHNTIKWKKYSLAQSFLKLWP